MTSKTNIILNPESLTIWQSSSLTKLSHSMKWWSTWQEFSISSSSLKFRLWYNTVVYKHWTINIPRHLLPSCSLPQLFLVVCPMPNMAALCQDVSYMPVHTDIDPVVCCCYVYICGRVASMNGQQWLFVWIIRTWLFQQFRQPIRVRLSWHLSLSLSCPLLATDDCNSSLEFSTHPLLLSFPFSFYCHPYRPSYLRSIGGPCFSVSHNFKVKYF